MGYSLSGLRETDWYEAIKAATYPEPPSYCTGCGRPMVRFEKTYGWTERGVRIILPGYRCQILGSRLRRFLAESGLSSTHDRVVASVGMITGEGRWADRSW